MYNLSIYHIQLFLPPLWLDWHAASARAVAGNFANIPARLSSKKRGFARWMEGSSQPWLTWFWNTAYLLAFCFLQKADLVPSKIFYVWHMLNDLHKECISPATEASRVALWGNLKTAGQIPTSWNHRERMGKVCCSFTFPWISEASRSSWKEKPPILKSATWKLQC